MPDRGSTGCRGPVEGRSRSFGGARRPASTRRSDLPRVRERWWTWNGPATPVQRATRWGVTTDASAARAAARAPVRRDRGQGVPRRGRRRGDRDRRAAGATVRSSSLVGVLAVVTLGGGAWAVQRGRATWRMPGRALPDPRPARHLVHRIRARGLLPSRVVVVGLAGRDRGLCGGHPDGRPQAGRRRRGRGVRRRATRLWRWAWVPARRPAVRTWWSTRSWRWPDSPGSGPSGANSSAPGSWPASSRRCWPGNSRGQRLPSRRSGPDSRCWALPVLSRNRSWSVSPRASSTLPTRRPVPGRPALRASFGRLPRCRSRTVGERAGR